eukprot:365257-Chlamydomonas_euryale.AAC.3
MGARPQRQPVRPQFKQQSLPAATQPAVTPMIGSTRVAARLYESSNKARRELRRAPSEQRQGSIRAARRLHQSIGKASSEQSKLFLPPQRQPNPLN